MGTIVADVAEQIPDVGHFIKTVSNGLYGLTVKCREYGGVGLLTPSRIRFHLREYNNEQNNLGTRITNTIELKDKITEARAVCLQRINSIIHHHCGNHDFCHKSHRKYKEIELQVTTKHNILGNGKTSELEIKKEVGKKYVKCSRLDENEY